jgi:hypothetical protein
VTKSKVHRAQIPRLVRWTFGDGIPPVYQDAVALAMIEIRQTIQFIQGCEAQSASTDAGLQEQREEWTRIFTAREDGQKALRRLAQLVVVGQVALARPGGRPLAGHHEAWLVLFDDVRATKGKTWSRSRICTHIAKDCRNSENKPVDVETVQHFIAKHRPK